MRHFILIGLLCFGASALGQDQTSEKQELAQKILSLSETDKMLDQMLDLMLGAITPQVPNKDEISQRLEKEFKARKNDFTNAMANLYVETFTAQELKDLIAFYESPTGKAFIQKMPELMQRSTVIGQQIGTEIAQKVLQDMGQ